MTDRITHPTPLDWALDYEDWRPKPTPPARQVSYTLNHLIQKGHLDTRAVATFRAETLFRNFGWRLLWADTDGKPDGESIREILMKADGIVVFVHGWDGSGEIWEDLPARLVVENPNLVALVPDVNGFGMTEFTVEAPPVEKCNPPAIMDSLQRWLDLIGVRTPAGHTPARPITFVGHSMGGAALFFTDESVWRHGELGRISCAPALLHNDELRQGFYKSLGAGIRLSGLNEFLDNLTEKHLAPKIIEFLAGGASEAVLEEHQRIFESTQEGVIARTFAAMGMLNVTFDAIEWPFFEVFLGHRDRLVGLQPFLVSLEEWRFNPEQLRVVLGDHYFFSISKRAPWHHKNRELLLKSILRLHNELNAALNG